MTRNGCKGGSKKSLPIPTKAPPQANQLSIVEGEGWSSEGEFEEEDKVDENGESSNEDEGEQGKGEIEQNGLPDGVGSPEKSNTWEPMGNLASITDMIDEFEKSLAKKKQQKKPLPSPSPVVIKMKNVCCANAGKTKECSKTMESPTNGQPQDQFGTKLIISEPKEELVVPKTNMASEDKSLQRSQEAQSVGGAKKKKRESGPSAKKFKFPKRGECVDLWNLGDDHFADKDLD
nr:chromo domain-containing protein LHP1 [Ipomoea batatas]